MKNWKKIVLSLLLVFAVAGCEVVKPSSSVESSSSSVVKTPAQIAEELADQNLDEASAYISFKENQVIDANTEVIAKVVRDTYTANVTYTSDSLFLSVGAANDLKLILTVNKPAVDFAEEYAVVKLTAVVTIDYTYVENSETKNASVTETKVFTVRIPRALPVQKSTVAEVIAAPVSATELTVEGTVYSVMHLIDSVDETKSAYSGFYIYDTTGSIYVYSNVKTVKLGDKVEVKGQKASYYGMSQITKTGASGTPTADVTVLSSDNPIDIALVTDKTIDDISKEDSLATTIYGKFYQLYAKVEVIVGTNTSTYLVDPYTGSKVEVYYTSSGIASVQALKDKFVTIKVPVYGYNKLWRVSYSDFAGSLVEASAPEMTETQKVDATKNLMTSQLNNKDLVEYSSIALSEAAPDFGATISWAVDTASEAKIAIADGKVAIKPDVSITEPFSVKIIGTITVGAATGTVEISFTAKALVVTTIDTIPTTIKGTMINIEGIVVGTSTAAFYLKDDTGITLVYATPASLGVAIGDKVTLNGKTDNFNGTPQLASPTLLRKVSTGNALDLVATPMTAAELVALTTETLPGKVNTFIEITLKIKVGGAYVNAVNPVNAASDIQFYKLDATNTAALAPYDGTDVKIKAFIYGNSKADLSGNWRLTLSSFEPTVELIEVGAPTNVAVSTEAVGSWDNVEGAKSYDVVILQGETVVKTINTTTNSIDLTTQGLETGDYTFKVMAKPGVGYKATTQYSAISSSFHVVKPAEPLNHVIINQIYTDGSATAIGNRFYELYNPTDVDVDMTGWVLTYGSATGELGTSVFNFEAGAKIKAHGYYLIAGTGSTGKVDITSPDATSTISASGSNGKLALLNNSTVPTSPTDANVVDYIGYGTANLFEGSGAAVSGSAAESISRTDFADTNNNANDFVKVANPTPRNSSYVAG